MNDYTTQQIMDSTYESGSRSSVRDAIDTPVTRSAQHMSEPLETNLGQEPANSAIRTILLAAAGASILGSIIMQIQDRKHESLFVGQWAPTLMIMALWYQQVKTQQHVRQRG